MDFKICMVYKCKTCPIKKQCDAKIKEERLMFRPFENLKEILEKRRYGNMSRQYYLR